MEELWRPCLACISLNVNKDCSKKLRRSPSVSSEDQLHYVCIMMSIQNMFGFHLLPYLAGLVYHEWSQDSLCDFIQMKLFQKSEPCLAAGRGSHEYICTLQEPLSLCQPPKGFSSSWASAERPLGWGSSLLALTLDGRLSILAEDVVSPTRSFC